MAIKKYWPKFLLWAGLIALYLLFIGSFTYLYPMSEDEMICPARNLFCYFYSYLNFCARIGALFNILLINSYKWSFVIINPIVQLVLVFATFYLVKLRLPDFKNLEDFPTFTAIALMTVFLVSKPDQTIFWFSGSVNYLFLGALFILFCAVMRKTWLEPDFIPSNTYTNLIAFFGGIILGMNNENSAPMIFCLCSLYTAAALLFKHKIPAWFIRLFTGVIIGLILMFSSPLYHKRAQADFMRVYFSTEALSTKIIKHLYKMDLFMASSFYALPLLCLSALLIFIDKFKTAIKSHLFFMFALSLFVSFVLAFVFFLVPFTPLRVFYSASLFTIIGLLFGIEYISKEYKFNLMPYLAAALLVFCAFIFKPFAKPYISLCQQGQQREYALKEALKTKDNQSIYLPLYKYTAGPNINLTIEHYDPMARKHPFINRFYNRKFISGKEFSDSNGLNI